MNRQVEIADSALIEKLNSSQTEDEAWAYIYKECWPMMESLIKKNNGTGDDAAEVFHDSLIVLKNQLADPNFELTCRIKTYVYSVCRNLWLKQLRKKHNYVEIDENFDFVEIKENALDSLVQNEQHELVADLMMQLGDECKKILQYYYFQKMRIKEIMQEMKLISEQVVKNKKGKCMKKLKESIFENPDYTEILR